MRYFSLQKKISRVDYNPPKYVANWNSVYKTDSSTIEQAILNSTFAVAAYEGGNLVGFARAVSDRVMFATVYDVMVLPEYKNKGIGSELVSNITGQCKDAGVISVHLFAADGTEEFYNKHGYKARPPNMPGMRHEPNT